MRVRAYAALKPGLDVEPYKLEISEPKSQEVLIKITHCSVGRGDVSFLRNDYQIPDLTYPLVAGHELVGVIESIGDDVVELAVGDRVGVGYQVSCCGECIYCRSGREELCQKQECLVMNRPGGFASHMVVNERFVFKIPDSLESAEAAPLLCSGLTVYSAIKKARIEKNTPVGVIGIGGLGHFAVQILNELGARVTAFSNKKNPEMVKELGATRVLPYESQEAILQSYDRLFLTTHAHIDYDYYLKLLKPGGELWIIGVDTQKTTFSSWLLNDFASRSIHGSYIGSPAEMTELLELAARRDIAGRTKTLPISQLNKALQMMADGNQEFRLVVEMRDS